VKLSELLTGLLDRGLRIGHRIGKPMFHPEFQERTSAMDDLTGKTKREKDEKRKT